jgi:hypothetical protein
MSGNESSTMQQAVMRKRMVIVVSSRHHQEASVIWSRYSRALSCDSLVLQDVTHRLEVNCLLPYALYAVLYLDEILATSV